MQEPMVSKFGYLVDTPDEQQVLHGCYEPSEGTDKYMKELLLELRMPQAIRDGIKEHGYISTKISQVENRQGWKKRRLALSEPSGLITDHYVVRGEEELINEIDTLLRQLPYRLGFSPEAWQSITDVKILKKAGIYDVELMRTIQLMHAELNMNKKLGRDMMSFAELCWALVAEQFGSCKNHQAILAPLNKRLTNDLLWQLRLAGALCVNDAKSCYNRIVNNIAILAIRRLGMIGAPVLSMFKTLQQAAYQVSTAFGVLIRTYGRKRQIPLQGARQGNGAGPAIWAAISSFLIMAVATQGHGFNILLALSYCQ
jgi:hypothetical protein